ncbi:MAG TPA: VCBS repeat-containing protein, partial [Chitinophagaceae bacterium]|nr:VCBS repeat-containing protein [Chitinophagaceae bacterium]
LVKQVVKHDSINYLDIVQMMPSTMLSNYIFHNNGNLSFANVTKSWGMDQPSLSNGAAYADLDNDGDLDIVVNNINAPAFIYRNESRGNYLELKLKGGYKNTAGIGAKVYCYTNGQMQFYEQMPVRGYQSSVSDVMHIGVGSATKIDSLKIIWLNGAMQVIANPKLNATLVADQANAKSAYLYSQKKNVAFFTPVRSFIDYTHLQLEYNDFKRQPLMPVMQSQCGPVMAAADVNGDGLQDVVIGASQGQGDAVYLQQANGSFALMPVADLSADSNANTTRVLLIDVDGDKDLDAYMSSGGYNDYEEDDPRLQDRLFLNDGKGNFTLGRGALPSMPTAKSCVAAADIDKDGDLDLFVGGNSIPGKYPEIAPSYLLLNDGKGKFTNIISPSLQKTGMVTDAAWTDVNKDGKPDLIIVGQWMQPMIFMNEGGKFSATSISDSLSGWWNTITLADIDNDGDEDIIAGNWGLNSQVHANAHEPLEIICKDFDNNGSIDPILCFYIQGKSYPYVSRDE